MSVALDTNVLVRFLTRDDARQSGAAARLMGERDTMVLDTVLLELEWVLRKTYRYDRDQIAAALEGLSAAAGIRVESPARLAAALPAYRAGLDFADAFHLTGAASATAFATFDEAFARRATALIPTPPILSL